MEALGCLILHGWTSTLKNVEALEPLMERLGLPYRMPILRGHCATPEQLYGVSWRDWHADATCALDDLLGEASQALLIGFSMGSLLALGLAAERERDVAGVAALATPLRVATPGFRFVRYLAPVFRRHTKGPPHYGDPALAAGHPNYPWVPTEAAVQLYDLTQAVERQLARVRAPLLLLQSRADRVVRPLSAQLAYDAVASTEKELVWVERSGHELLLDCEREAVVQAVERFIVAQRSKLA
jgi:carboxylesterase